MCLLVSRPHDRNRSESPRPSRVTRHSAKSVSRYDDEHIIGSRSTAARPAYIYGPGGNIVGVQGERNEEERRQMGHSRASAPSTSRYDDEHLISPPMFGRTGECGIAVSISDYDDEHVISSSKDVGKKGGSRDKVVMGLFSGESSHGKEREGRRIGEKFVGSQYGPGKFLGGKSSMKTKRESKKGEGSGRPKEYGI